MRVRICFAAILLLASAAEGQSGAHAVHKEQKQATRKSEDFLFEVQPREIAPGETALLRWSIKGATRVRIDEMAGSQRQERALGTFENSSGTLEVRPVENTTYIISCEGSTTYTCASATIRVRVKPAGGSAK